MKLGSLLNLAAEYVRPSEEVTELSPEEVHKRLRQPGCHIYDCNLSNDYARGHIPGAMHAGIDELDREILPTDLDTELIFYCSGKMCLSCHMVARKALEYGYTRVCIMPEGMRGWRSEGRPVDHKPTKQHA